jgi:hypothetical protein
MIRAMYKWLLAAFILVTPQMHAGNIATVEASTYESVPVFQNCSYTSDGPLVQCHLLSADQEDSSDSEASASFGNLFAEADAGNDGSDFGGASSSAMASFSADVIFAQTGMITGTWFVTYSQVAPSGVSCMGDVIVMGLTVSCSHTFTITIPFEYSGGPITISASELVFASTPFGEEGTFNVQLISFSSAYTVLPEPGTFGLIGAPLLALSFVRLRRRPNFLTRSDTTLSGWVAGSGRAETQNDPGHV